MKRRFYLNIDKLGNIVSLIETTDSGVVVPKEYYDITDNKDKNEIINNQKKYKIENGKLVKKDK